jgi:hypothetical protein
MGKKGLSYEEKRQRMLQYFYEKREVLTLKELEKNLPKAKQIGKKNHFKEKMH